MSPISYSEAKNRTYLQNQLNDVVTGIFSSSDVLTFDKESKNKLIEECNALKNAMQDLFKSYESRVINKKKSSNYKQFFRSLKTGRMEFSQKFKHKKKY